MERTVHRCGAIAKGNISVVESSVVRKDTEKLVELVRKNERPKDAPHVRRYIKTGLECLGVRKPVLHSIAKDIFNKHKQDGNMDAVYGIVSDLWEVPIYDVKTLAISILRQFGKRLDRTTFDVVDAWFDDVDNWSHCDGLSVYVLGSIILKDDSVVSEIMEWIRSKNFWRRRAALTSTMLGNRKGKADPFWTFTMLNDVLDDREHYVRKVFSWVLREMGKGFPDFVYEYLMYNKSKLTKKDIEESVKYLPEEKARIVLELDFS